ncbi:unnamed product [Ostreococcus tauri]|uniref:Unnamed product n=1 Tax=Ostreococcus tauri TaxID=70448 RepID=Q00TS7_OSTTA|nr:unnamed product [Ostreococcus tauri]CAL57739.1 unnamed product [Ostreococcus tauri]|eukprot:XP_003083772.1 unnamed product [Ostreococcus tauri]
MTTVVLVLAALASTALAGEYACTATCVGGAGGSTGCGAGYVLSNACGSSDSTYEGCASAKCDAECANATGAKAIFGNFTCYNTSNVMKMTAADATQQSVAMNCEPAGSHAMPGSMFMAGATHTACDAKSAAGRATTLVVALLASFALMM